MSNKKKKSTKKQPQKQKIRIQWQKLKWPLTLVCAGLALALAFGMLLTYGVPVKSAESPDGRIALEMRWMGFGRYASAYTLAPEGKEADVELQRVRKLVAVEFTNSSRYAIFVYKGPQGKQYFHMVDYQTGKIGTIDRELIFKTDLPGRQDATNIQVTFVRMDEKYDAALFRVDYTMADGQKNYEHITYDFKTEDLK